MIKFGNNSNFTSKMQIGANMANASKYLLLQLSTPLPTAFIFNCDLSESNFMTGMMARGYSIPQDISVASFDKAPPFSWTFTVDKIDFIMYNKYKDLL